MKAYKYITENDVYHIIVITNKYCYVFWALDYHYPIIDQFKINKNKLTIYRANKLTIYRALSEHSKIINYEEDSEIFNYVNKIYTEIKENKIKEYSLEQLLTHKAKFLREIVKRILNNDENF